MNVKDATQQQIKPSGRRTKASTKSDDLGERIRVSTENVLVPETYLVAGARDPKTDQSVRQSEDVDAADQEDLELL